MNADLLSDKRLHLPDAFVSLVTKDFVVTDFTFLIMNRHSCVERSINNKIIKPIQPSAVCHVSDLQECAQAHRYHYYKLGSTGFILFNIHLSYSFQMIEIQKYTWNNADYCFKASVPDLEGHSFCVRRQKVVAFGLFTLTLKK